MAIIIEEEKNRANIMGIVGWLVFFAVIAAAIYYVFFAAPTSVITPPPANLASTAPISQITLHPEDVVNNKLFQSLKQYVSSSSQPPAVIGRPNPFIPPQ